MERRQQTLLAAAIGVVFFFAAVASGQVPLAVIGLAIVAIASIRYFRRLS
jgi:hypothetical protein